MLHVVRVCALYEKPFRNAFRQARCLQLLCCIHLRGLNLRSQETMLLLETQRLAHCQEKFSADIVRQEPISPALEALYSVALQRQGRAFVIICWACHCAKHLQTLPSEEFIAFPTRCVPKIPKQGLRVPAATPGGLDSGELAQG